MVKLLPLFFVIFCLSLTLDCLAETPNKLPASNHAPSQTKIPTQTTIMVVDFELRDVSPIPNTTEELERTALLDTTIRNALGKKGYQLLKPCAALLSASQQGLGYLYDRPEVAAQAGHSCGADYVLMGQTWKPSFLFVFPQVQVVDTRPNLSRERLVVVSRAIQLEASTLDKNVTESAGQKLADQIADKLNTIHFR